jgi:hypothetical protein
MVAYACHGVWLPAVHLFYFDCFILFFFWFFVLWLPENWVCCHASKEIMLFTLQCMSCNLVFFFFLKMRRRKKRPQLTLRILMNYLNPVLIQPLRPTMSQTSVVYLLCDYIPMYGMCNDDKTPELAILLPNLIQGSKMTDLSPFFPPSRCQI